MADDTGKDDTGKAEDTVDEAEGIIQRFGDEVDKRVNKILDERLRVDPPDDEKKEGEDGEEKKEGGDKDEAPAPKTFAERLGF